MPQFQTPGVYVQEIPSLPPGVAEVKSAIPAFIGYTQKTKYNETDLLNQPTKIQSMLEFKTFFGDGVPYAFSGITASLVDTDKNATVNPLFYLFDSLQLYFLNGGGPCYIVSVGAYPDSNSGLAASAYATAFDNLDLFDEPTLYIMPDAVLLVDDQLATVQQLALQKCATLMDRFAILDVKKNTNPGKSLDAADTFRNKLGMANLKYGAAYTPWLNTNLDKTITAASINNIFNILLASDASILNFKVNGKTISTIIAEYKSLYADLTTLKTSCDGIVQSPATFTSMFTADIGTVSATNSGPFKATTGVLWRFQNIMAGPAPVPTNTEFAGFFTSNCKNFIDDLKQAFDALGTTDTAAQPAYLNNILRNGTLDRFNDLYTYIKQGLQPLIDSYEKMLVGNIPYYAGLLSILKNKLTSLPPSGIMAGLYCQTDSARGVWKSPANISVSGVSGVTQLYTAPDLDSLNIDATAGKSINVIRPIVGVGVMVMGARTLDGASSEWRYIAVRRLFIFLEENLRKSTAWAVFEPNDKMLWTTIKAQVNNYLFEIWRLGALAGSKPEDAYQVNCGLNSTMTSDDILKGFLKVEIKLAAVRPAEFIVLKFSHQLQKS